MYHTVYPSQMMVQIMSGHQTNGQCPSSQTHAIHINGVNALHQSDFTQYGPNITTQRHRVIQTGSPLDLLQLMGVNVPSLRGMEYLQPSNNSSSANWERRIMHTNNASIIPFSNYNFKPTNINSTKKPCWYNKNRRSSYKNSFSKYEAYNSDSGFSSRSPTPNKYYIDNSLTESSDERDSTSSLKGQWLNRKHHKIQSDNARNNYQRPINHDTSNSTQRSRAQNYHNKKRYVPTKNNNTIIQRHPRNRKYHEMPNYDVFPGCITTPDRFLARSHLLIVPINDVPNDLLTDSSWDDLSMQIWRKFVVNQQTEDTYKKKIMLWKHLNTYFKSIHQHYNIFFVGSTMNGFGSNDSDVDICLLVKDVDVDNRDMSLHHLLEIYDNFSQCDFVDRLNLIHARVPIITFYDTVRKFKADMNCNNSIAIKNTHLLYCYSKLDWRVKPLTLVIKLWAQVHDINDAKKKTLSSYCLCLMVIHFLQCGTSPPILPCLHSIFPNKFQDRCIYNIDIHEELNIPSSSQLPKNNQSLGELLIEFFKYYMQFDFDQYAISVRLGSKILKTYCSEASGDSYQWKYLCIEEPFDLSNAARSVYDYDIFTLILFIMKMSYSTLKRNHNLGDVFREWKICSFGDDGNWVRLLSDEEC
ncbi:poly(A) RNA polymerase gld-2 homolog A-like isoform X1 [Pogonomyrmex barbatus]|uniref:Poly(A) RNA polymerase gld-2 homolog A-like isoform X1 n=1 Tax=Pogonomyrmex barbatus TaxID=144034 RepID=A0A6I9WFV5_9HYME|nr:poly(A) RNA polymerase gld-2 homolog A-like isoform X1 [Pogonomyrmex barbatus]XP_011638104.1 poly(A) RNA polymerase gld-2 homolog A-like isoform X1 [Pogonomyrmex barbatus]XP_011638105.1 poly(A) RNA polymerase gld-2 homolog A-like isoform X1 [Pogonomyrmex barbatus]XP_011638106.1 poly(A) RNA polymerase gld-2 homolog A-like isoform X1 [Pogonomyrmex barbatus]XP_011638107.1 poly(A) RNA polymerase gld-2 homolog A-like isoform X1 [Pogonomyrmex barbatus]XP_011638108.1 poly(A) RNA polymerase gld-2 h